MRYKLLGRSGLRVSELALGTMTFGEDWGWGASKSEAQKIFDAFVEMGGNFIDTSNNYTDGTSEKIVGELVASERERFVIATKYTLSMRKDDPNGGGNSRKNMMQAVEASLRRLNTDYIDVYYLHMWDFTTPLGEIMRAFDDLVRQGKILYPGLSDTPSWVIAEAVRLADDRGWARPVATQLPYSVVGRTPESDMLPMAYYHDVAVTAWGLVQGGVLTGKYGGNGSEPRRYDDVGDESIQRAAAFNEIAADIGRTPSQVAINWVRQRKTAGAHPAPQIIPILGARTEAQIKENLGVLHFDLSNEQIARLDELNPPKLSFPHPFLSGDHVRELIFGETFDSLDNHRSPAVVTA